MDFFILHRFLGRIVDFFLPRTCIICETVLFDDEESLCRKCAGDIPHTYFWLLRNNPMADKFNALIQEDLVEAWKEGDGALGQGERYAYGAALFFYRSDSEYRKITQVIKYHGRVDVGRSFGLMLGKRLRSSALYADVDALVPVPLHWIRQWDRGYNQAEVIASGVAEAMGVPLRNDILRRCRHTKTQTRLDIDEKSRNVKGAFAVDERWLKSMEGRACLPSSCSIEYPNPDSTLPELRHLLLIDDVYTTGSTLHACFTALRTAFPPPVRISIATLGFVGGG